MFNPDLIKADFPIFNRKINGQTLVYLDNAATSQKPNQVIDAISDYYRNHNANVHRGVHTLSDESTNILNTSRQTIADFFGAENEELILVCNTTEAINGVRYGWLDSVLKKDDVILTSLMEHHSNIVMWQEACKKAGANLIFIDLNNDGSLNLEDLIDQLTMNNDRIKLISLVHVSNTLGTLNPIEKIVEIISKKYSNKNHKPKILIDGAQSAPHLLINFHNLDVDFFAFSGHKMLGPMGIGGLLVRKKLITNGEFKPWLFGGGMISSVSHEKTEFHEDFTELFTAGTPDVASAVGLATACKYLSDLGMKNVYEHDQELVLYALKQLSKIPEITIVGQSNVTSHLSLDTDEKLVTSGHWPVTQSRVGSVAFLYEGVHAHDVAQILDSQGLAVRSGHHCTMPLHTHFNWQATTRVSFQVYNSKADVDILVAGLEKVREVFKIK